MKSRNGAFLGGTFLGDTFLGGAFLGDRLPSFYFFFFK